MTTFTNTTMTMTTTTATTPAPSRATPDSYRERWPAPLHPSSRTPFTLKTLVYGSYLLSAACVALAVYIVVGLIETTAGEAGGMVDVSLAARLERRVGQKWTRAHDHLYHLWFDF